jgi:sarcosine oxidase
MFDVIVVGLGGMGSAAAYHLASRGKRVLGIEQYRAAHPNGSSHGDSRIIRQAYHESPEYVPLVRRAYELWERLEKDTGTNVLRLTGGLMIGPPGSSVVQGTVRSAAEHNLPIEVLDSSQLRRRFPVLNPRKDDSAVYEVRAGFLRPEAAIVSHLDLAAHLGAELHFEERLESWESEPSGRVRVVTSHGSYEGVNLVLAPGAWAPKVLSELGIPFEVLRHAMCWFQPQCGIESFLPEYFPIYIWDVNGQQCFYGFPATSGAEEGVKVAMHSGGDRCSPATISREISERDVQEVRNQIAAFIPSLTGPLVKASACMYTMTPDEHFIVSLHPSFPNVAIAAGFSGHGFKFTTVVGEILADLIITGRTSHSIELFSPGRFRNGSGPKLSDQQ